MVSLIEKYHMLHDRYFASIASVLMVFVIVLIIVLPMLSIYFPTIREYEIQSGMISAFILLVLLDATSHLIKINRKINPVNIAFYNSQSEADNDILGYVRDHKPRKADFIQYSANNVGPVIKALNNKSCKIRLLIAHPDIAISTGQRRRITSNVETLVKELSGFKNIEIRCYNQYYDSRENENYRFFPSLRAILFDGKYICFSWYTPTLNEHCIGGIVGADNPILCGYTANKEGKVLKSKFDDLFTLLWKNGIDIKDVNDELSRDVKRQGRSASSATSTNDGIAKPPEVLEGL